MTQLRWLSAGESHGPELVATVEGIPAGMPLLAEDIDEDLARRQRGYGRGGRMKIETDRVRLVAGVRGGETLGGPIAMVIENRDHASWAGRMGPEPFPEPPEELRLPPWAIEFSLPTLIASPPSPPWPPLRFQLPP